MSKPYSGYKSPPPSDRPRASIEDAVKNHQVRYYGIKQIPMSVIKEVRHKDLEPLKVKLAILHIKMKKAHQLYRYSPDESKAKEKYKLKAQKLAKEFESLRAELHKLEK